MTHTVARPPVIPADPPAHAPRTTEERARRLRAAYESGCAILGIPPYDSSLESAMTAAGVGAVLEASRPCLP